jgi:uncharacterized protein YndB with AHSA1/START domain
MVAHPARRVIRSPDRKEDRVPDIRHRVAISAPLAQVYEAVATTEGISEWWTRDGVQGESNEGSRLEFYFGRPEPAAVMEVTRLDAEGHVSWKCIDGAEEWVGTELTFDLREDEDETVVLFTHADWREPVEFMAHCSTRWAYFLLSLKSYLETGMGTPFPEDLKF